MIETLLLLALLIFLAVDMLEDIKRILR